jgi:hypothetical protein
MIPDFNARFNFILLWHLHGDITVYTQLHKYYIFNNEKSNTSS